jgi:hypothetical protein
MFGRIGRNIGRGIVAAGRVAPVLLRDLLGLGAIGLIAYGSWLVHPAAGFIVAGALLLVGVLLLSAKRPIGG